MNEFISYGRFQCTELAPHKNRGLEITYVEKGMLEWMVEGGSGKGRGRDGLLHPALAGAR